MQTITLSIEPFDGKSYQHGFHLGTDIDLAKTIAAEYFNANQDKWRTVALKSNGKIIDVFDGKWFQDSV